MCRGINISLKPNIAYFIIFENYLSKKNMFSAANQRVCQGSKILLMNYYFIFGKYLFRSNFNINVFIKGLFILLTIIS